MSINHEDSAKLLEVSGALEIVKKERDHLRAEVSALRDQLVQATARAERSEARLHDVTMAMVELSREAILSSVRSQATEVMMDGKTILRLNNPVVMQR
jgi:alpha-D-ribose 1-methylphosphonate 5-triphosphate synthase subunit PhnG